MSVIRQIQTNNGNPNNGPAHSVTLSVLAGSTLVALCCSENANTSVSVADDGGNTWQQVSGAAIASSPWLADIWIAKNVAANSALTITATFNALTNGAQLVVYELRNVGDVVDSGNAHRTGAPPSNPVLGPSMTASRAAVYLTCLVGDYNGGRFATGTVASPWTLDTQYDVSDFASLVDSGGATEQASFTLDANAGDVILSGAAIDIPPQCDKPSISPTTGTYPMPQTVTLTCTTAGATITYTTDQSDPVPGSHGTAVSSGATFSISSGTLVKAIASKTGFSNSDIASETLLQAVCAQAVIAPTSGAYTNPLTVTLTCPTAGSTITYTTDGSDPVPGFHGTEVSSGATFSLGVSATVKAFAWKTGYISQFPQIVSATYAVGAHIDAITPSEQLVGAPVTITGTNFTASQGTVRFNGVRADVVSWSDTTIVCSVPSGIAPNPVSVIVNASGVDSNAKTFTFILPSGGFGGGYGSQGVRATPPPFRQFYRPR